MPQVEVDRLTINYEVQGEEHEHVVAWGTFRRSPGRDEWRAGASWDALVRSDLDYAASVSSRAASNVTPSSEERRVGKECRSRGAPDPRKRKNDTRHRS